jgi:hypothetical protein
MLPLGVMHPIAKAQSYPVLLVAVPYQMPRDLVGSILAAHARRRREAFTLGNSSASGLQSTTAKKTFPQSRYRAVLG